MRSLGVTLPEAIEQIDIGGPTLLRAAAKNHAYLTVLCDPVQYETYLDEMRQSQGEVSPGFRSTCARQAFWLTAAYDQAIATYLTDQALADEADATLPERFALTGRQRQILRYGENPHQAAAWYQMGGLPTGWAGAEQLQGKELSYNNWVDLEAARRIIAEFPADLAAAAILKHTNPCGVALGTTLTEAYEKAFAADSISAFGGIVALNQPIDQAMAMALTQTFLECIVAPACEPDAESNSK